jgi:hypothetical protein
VARSSSGSRRVLPRRRGADRWRCSIPRLRGRGWLACIMVVLSSAGNRSIEEQDGVNGARAPCSAARDNGEPIHRVGPRGEGEHGRIGGEPAGMTAVAARQAVGRAQDDGAPRHDTNSAPSPRPCTRQWARTPRTSAHSAGFRRARPSVHARRRGRHGSAASPPTRLRC